MNRRRMPWRGGIVCALAGLASAPAADWGGSSAPTGTARLGLFRKRPAPAAREMGLSSGVKLEQVSPQQRDRLAAVLGRPSLHSGGRWESFYCDPAHYHWLLDHPDRAVKLWRKLGAECAGI